MERNNHILTCTIFRY